MKLFKQISLRLCLAVVFFVLAYSMLSLAQSSPTPAPSATPAVVSAASPSGLAGLVNSKGGLVAFVTLCVLCLNMIMSSVRLMLYKWDGINPGDQVPANATALTFVNKVCIVLGNIVDFFGQNV